MRRSWNQADRTMIALITYCRVNMIVLEKIKQYDLQSVTCVFSNNNRRIRSRCSWECCMRIVMLHPVIREGAACASLMQGIVSL